MSTNINHILKTTGSYKIAGTLWVEYIGERCFGPGRMELLQLIDKTGSINKAAKEMGMSYKKALGMITALNLQMNQTLVITQTGGESGGGSSLSDAAFALMKYHVDLRLRFQTFLKSETKLLLKSQL